MYIDCYPTTAITESGACGIILFRMVAQPWELRLAFQNLEHAVIAVQRPAESWRPSDDAFAGNKNDVVKYVSGMLSSPRLQFAHVNLSIFSVFWNSALTSACLIAPALNTMITSHLRRLVLQYVEFSQGDWDDVCEGLSEHLEEVTLVEIRLLPGGIWKPSLNMLRAKTESRCAKGECTLHISRLHGGEFEGEDQNIHVEGWWDCVTGAPFDSDNIR